MKPVQLLASLSIALGLTVSAGAQAQTVLKIGYTATND
jgi:hypothetical protein